MDYAINLSALEEVSDTNGELASVAGDVGVTGVTVDEAVVVADVEADDVEEVNGDSATEHDIETAVLIFIIVVVDFGILGETGYRTLDLGVGSKAVCKCRTGIDPSDNTVGNGETSIKHHRYRQIVLSNVNFRVNHTEIAVRVTLRGQSVVQSGSHIQRSDNVEVVRGSNIEATEVCSGGSASAFGLVCRVYESDTERRLCESRGPDEHH